MTWTRHVPPVALLILLILFANSLALSGLFNDDPAMFLSGLQTGASRILPGVPNWYDPNIGFTEQALGQLAANDWLNGSPPWWNQYSGAGMPLAAELQNDALFLPFMLVLHFHSGWLWLRVILQILAGLFTYFLLTILNLSRFASLLAALLYGCMGSFVMLAHAPAGAFPCLPLLLLGIELTRKAVLTGRPRGWSMITVALAYSFYSGFPETGFMGDLFGAAWLLCRTVAMPFPAIRPFMLKSLLAAALAGGLILPGLLPFAQYLSLGYIGGHASEFATARLQPASLTLELLPFTFGFPGTIPAGSAVQQGAPGILLLYSSWGGMGGWVGALPVMLAMLGFASRSDGLRALKWLLAAWALIWQLRIFGAPGITELLNLIPGIPAIAVERYALPSIDFSIILLAGFALDNWRRGLQPARFQNTLVFLFVLGLLGAALGFGWPIQRAMATSFPLFNFVAITYLSIIAAILLAASLCLNRKPSSVLAAALALVISIPAICGFGLSQAAGARSGHLDTSGVRYLQERLGLQRIFTLGPLAPNYGADDGIAEINHNALPVPKTWTRYVNENLDPYADPIVFNGDDEMRPIHLPDATIELRNNLMNYQAIGVKYVLTPPGGNPFSGLAVPPPKVFGNAVMDIYELPNPAPYFSAAGAVCSLDVQTRQTLAANCLGPAILTRQELFYPGWHATVNGRAAAIVQTGQIFQSITLPAGQSQISFWYRPPHIRLACAIAIAAIFIWLGLGLAPCLRPPRLRTPPVAADSVLRG